MDVESRKLTDYEKAELWSQIEICGDNLRDNNRKSQNSGEFYKTVDKLLELQRKLKWHEVACTIEKGEVKEKMQVTLTACDKDSSGGFVKSYEFENKGQFLAHYNEFKEEVPFSRWYIEVESEDAETEKRVESWLED